MLRLKAMPVNTYPVLSDNLRIPYEPNALIDKIKEETTPSSAAELSNGYHYFNASPLPSQ